jgi:hypothetical protein
MSGGSRVSLLVLNTEKFVALSYNLTVGISERLAARSRKKSKLYVYYNLPYRIFNQFFIFYISVLKDDFKQQPKDTQTVLGGAAILECSPPKGQPEPVVSWKKDNEILNPDSSRR